MWRSGVRKANRCDPDQPGDYLVRLMPSDRPSAAVDAYTVGSTDTLGWLTEWPPQLPDRTVSGNMSPASSPSPGDRPAPQADVFSCPPWAARPTPVSGCPRRTPAGLADGYPRSAARWPSIKCGPASANPPQLFRDAREHPCLTSIHIDVGSAPRGTTADPCRPSVRGVRSRSQPHPSPTARHVSRMHVIGWPRLGLLLGPAVVRLTGGRTLHLVDKPQTARHFVARDLERTNESNSANDGRQPGRACTTAATCWP